MKKRRHEYIGEFIYGGMDGLVTTFAVVAGATGGLLTTKIVIILGFANLFSDGLSMAIGNYLSTQAVAAHQADKHRQAFFNALITFSSFLVMGLFPMLPYMFHSLYPQFPQADIFISSCIITGCVFILIGFVKAKITQTPIYSSIIQTFGLGVVAAFAAFYVGKFLERVIGG